METTKEKAKKNNECGSTISSTISSRRHRHHKKKKSSRCAGHDYDDKKRKRRQRQRKQQHTDIRYHRVCSSSYDSRNSDDDDDEDDDCTSSVSSIGKSLLSCSSTSFDYARKRKRKSKKKRRRKRASYSSDSSSDSSDNDENRYTKRRRGRETRKDYNSYSSSDSDDDDEGVYGRRRKKDVNRRKIKKHSRRRKSKKHSRSSSSKDSSDGDSDSYGTYKRRKDDKRRRKRDYYSRSHHYDCNHGIFNHNYDFNYGTYHQQTNNNYSLNTYHYKTNSNYSLNKYRSDKMILKTEAVCRNQQICDLGSKGRWEEMLFLFEKDRDKFTNVNYATMMNQLGRLKNVPKQDPLFVDFLQNILQDILSLMNNKGLQCIGVQQTAMIVHSIAKMRLRSKESNDILELVSKQHWAKWLVKEGQPQSISNLAWAFAKLDFEAPNLFAEIEKNAAWLVDSGIPQNIGNTAWAFATLGIRSQNLFTEIEYSAKTVLTCSQAITNTAWAFATLGIKAPNFFMGIEEHAAWIVREGLKKPQVISNTFWAVSRFKYDTPNLASEIDRCGKELVEIGDTQNISNVALAFSVFGYKATTFFTAVEANIERFLKNGNRIIKNGTQQCICNMLYALAVLDNMKEYKKTLTRLWDHVMDINPEAITYDHLPQLYLVHEFAKADGITLVEPSALLWERMNNWKGDDTQSYYQKEISSLLTEIGFIHEEEVSPLADRKTGGMLSIDMACRERMIAIEFDGESHYLVGLPRGEVLRRENGTTKAKRRYLERIGWKVINLNYQDTPTGNKEQKIQWLSNKLGIQKWKTRR